MQQKQIAPNCVSRLCWYWERKVEFILFYWATMTENMHDQFHCNKIHRKTNFCANGMSWQKNLINRFYSQKLPMNFFYVIAASGNDANVYKYNGIYCRSITRLVWIDSCVNTNQIVNWQIIMRFAHSSVCQLPLSSPMIPAEMNALKQISDNYNNTNLRNLCSSYSTTQLVYLVPQINTVLPVIFLYLSPIYLI